MSQEDLTKKPGEETNGDENKVGENGEENQNGAQTTLNNPNQPIEDDDDDTEILKLADEVKAKIEGKGKGEGKGEKKYSDEDMENMARRLEKKFSGMREADDEDFIDLLDPNAVKRVFVRLARLKSKDGEHKFIVALKNLNTDDYSDEPIYLTQIENPAKKGEMIPWATFIAEDGEEILYPYLSFMNRASGVWAEVLSEEKEDVSEKHGLVEAKILDEDEWKMRPTGKKILAKALKYRVTYVVKEIRGGKTLKVSQDVINKVEAPYPDLRKFLEANPK